MKEPLKTGFEYDAILARKMYCYTDRAGVVKKAKKQVNKRARRNWKKELRDGEIHDRDRSEDDGTL